MTAQAGSAIQRFQDVLSLFVLTSLKTLLILGHSISFSMIHSTISICVLAVPVDCTLMLTMYNKDATMAQYSNYLS